MSLFNRLEKIRARGEKEEEGMFGVPDLDLSPPANSGVASESDSNFDEEAPKRRSPLELLQQRDAQAPHFQAAQLPPTENRESSPDESSPDESSAPVETQEAEPEVFDELVRVPWPATPFKRPALFEEELKKSETQSQTAPEMASQSDFAPVEASAPEAPVTAFDRLMAARSQVEREPKIASATIAGAPTVSLSERLAAIRAPEMDSAPESEIPSAEMEASPAPVAADEAVFESVSVAESEPKVAPVENEVEPQIPTAPAPISEEIPVVPAAVETAPATPIFEASLPSADVLTESASTVDVPAVAAPTLSLRERLAMQESAPTPQSAPETAPVETAPPGPLSMSDRFAARGNLDRAPVREASESLLPSANAATPSMALDRTGASLARIEDGPGSEREARNRSLYGQKHLIFDAVLGALDPRVLHNATKESLRPLLERNVDAAARSANLNLENVEKMWMVEEFTRETLDLGPLVLLLEDPSVNKILVVGAGDVAVEKLGRIERTGVAFRDDDHLLAIVRRIAEMTGGRLDAKVPLLDRPLPDGARIRAKIPPLAPQPTLTIEKSAGNPFVALKRQQAERDKAETLPYSQLRDRIQQRLLREFETQTGAVNNPEKLRSQVEEMISQVIVEERVVVTRAEKAALVMDLLNEIVGLGPLEPLLNDPDIDEIMVNGPFQIYVERKGKLEVSGQRFRDNNHVMQVIDRIIAPLGRRIDEKSPMVDGRLRDGSRFNAIIPPLALSGPTMTIRKFARDPLTMTDLINFGSLTREAAQFLQCAVEGRLNIVVSGGTGSGKTTTLNVLSSFIPSTERIVTIEDAAELQLRQEHVIRLETRPPNIEGIGEISIRDLVRNALRMRPDRIVIGECRGGEALDMLQAMNTGHDGSLTTGHSNGPRDTLKRLETMVMMAGFDLPIKAIREQVSMAVQLIVHQERMRDGKRRVTAITEIVGMEGDVITMQDLFRFEQERIDDDGRIIGSLVATGLRPKNYDTIVDNGVELSMELFQTRSPHESGVRGRLSEHRVGTR